MKTTAFTNNDTEKKELPFVDLNIISPINIMITGSNGQLGQELINSFKTGKCEIGEIPQSLRVANIFPVDIYEVDICNQNQVISFCRKNDITIIINCAAYTNVDKCEKDQDSAFKVNSIGPRNLAIVSEKLGIKLIHISTDYVFDGKNSQHYREWDICNPKNIYGSTKYMGEQYVQSFCSKYLIIRTSWLYGYVGNNFVKSIINKAKLGEPFKVVNDQFGCPTNANDLVYHILKLVDANECGLFHCSGNGQCSWYDFALKIMEYSNIECDIIPCTTQEFPTLAKRPKFSVIDNMMLRCTVGDEMRNWKYALQEYIDKIFKE